jgi:hypothetical protein
MQELHTHLSRAGRRAAARAATRESAVPTGTRYVPTSYFTVYVSNVAWTPRAHRTPGPAHGTPRDAARDGAPHGGLSNRSRVVTRLTPHPRAGSP